MTNVTIVALFLKKMVGKRQKRNRNVEKPSIYLMDTIPGAADLF